MMPDQCHRGLEIASCFRECLGEFLASDRAGGEQAEPGNIETHRPIGAKHPDEASFVELLKRRFPVFHLRDFYRGGRTVLSPFAPGLAGRVNARRAIIRPGWRTVQCGA